MANRGDHGDDPASTEKKRTPVWLKILICLGILIVILVVVTRTLVSSFSMPTSSMENSIMAGDVFFVNRIDTEPERGDIIVFEFPGMRDQVTPNRHEYYIKRCVAMAGDTLQIINKVVHINGTAQPNPPDAVVSNTLSNETTMTFPQWMRFTRDNWGPMRVPKKGDVIPLNDSTFAIWRTFILRESHASAEQSGDMVAIDGKAATSYTVERDYIFGMGDKRDNSLDSRYWGFIPVESIVGKPWIVFYSSDPSGRETRSDRIFKRVE